LSEEARKEAPKGKDESFPNSGSNKQLKGATFTESPDSGIKQRSLEEGSSKERAGGNKQPERRKKRGNEGEGRRVVDVERLTIREEIRCQP